MENKELINKILNAARSSVEIEHKSHKNSCGKYSDEDFEKYWDGELDNEDSKVLESHCLDCPFCIQGLKSSKEIIEQADTIGATISDDMLFQAAQEYMEQSQASMLWAAKGKPSGYNGEANGVAISEKGDMAVIIRCNAYIDKELTEKGQLDICGIPVLKTPDGAETRSPLDSLEDKLEGPLRAIPLFRDFNLHKRYINIDIGECHFTEAWSLSLAIVMSLINALYQRKDDPLTIYSANVISSGALEPVEKIVRKLIAAKEKGVRRFILSSKNRNNVPQELLHDPDFEVLFFDDLDQVINFLELSPLLATEESTQSPTNTKDDEGVKQQTENSYKNEFNGEYAMYKPKPIDTDHIEVPKNLVKLTELLSENSHDIWAKARMEEGWTFGPQRDDKEKKHPDLIPYDELFPSEQEYDRKTVLGVIKAIMALGYQVEKK
jgi:hypothetical protein